MTTLFVRKTGNDANGGLNPTDAVLTIQRALTIAPTNAEVVIYVGAGVYEERLSLTKSGFSDAKLFSLIADIEGVHTGDPGDVVIDAYGSDLDPTNAMCFHINNCEFLYITNFKCRDYTYGSYITGGNSDYITFDGCNFENSQLEENWPVYIDSALNLLIWRCIFQQTRKNSITIDSCYSLRLFNNTFLFSPAEDINCIEVNYATEFDGKNNIFSKVSGSNTVTIFKINDTTYLEKISFDYDCFYNIDVVANIIDTVHSYINWKQTTLNDVNSITTNPLLLSDFSPSEDSPCRDAGIVPVIGSYPYSGSAPDIGAKEFWDSPYPRIYNESPLEDATDILPNTSISFDLDDPINGINIVSLNVTIPDPSGVDIYAIYEGLIQEGFHGSIVADGSVYHITLNPDFEFTYGQEVEVSITVKDVLGHTTWLVYTFIVVPNPEARRDIERANYDIDIIQIEQTARFDLRTDVVGHITVARGREKLVNQIIRAIINKTNKNQFITASTISDVRATVLEILRQFRKNQINFEYESDDTIVGYDIYKLTSGVYQKINKSPATRFYVDQHVVNGVSYTYQVLPVYKNTREFISYTIATATPSNTISGNRYIFYPRFVIQPDDSQISFYFSNVRYFLAEELLESLDSVQVIQGQDPRNLIVNVNAFTLDQQPVVIDRSFFIV